MTTFTTHADFTTTVTKVVAPAENKQVQETQTCIEASEKSELFQLRHRHFSQSLQTAEKTIQMN